VLSGEAVSA